MLMMLMISTCDLSVSKDGRLDVSLNKSKDISLIIANITQIVQNCRILDIKESIYLHTYSQSRLVMPGRGKDSSSSNSTNDSSDEIKVLLNEKFDEFSNKIVSTEDKFDTTAREIYMKMEQIEKKAEDAKTNASNNSDEIESLRFEMKEQGHKISKQFETISKLESEIEELKNRSLRKTLMFKNIKYQQVSESSWSATKSVLIELISRILPETTKEEISNNIERAHRVHSKGTSSNGSPPYLVVKMVNWAFSENVKSAFIQENQNGRSQVFVSQMYSKSLTLRQNQALKHRLEMKEEDPSIQGYIRYPATLMIKRPGEKKYKVEKDF